MEENFMFKKVEKKLDVLTTTKAEKILSFNTFDSQRRLDQKWVTLLAGYIDKDLFTMGHIVLSMLKNNGKSTIYLLNGQHQANAVLLANKSIDAVIEKYSCPTMADVSLLYRQVNNAKVSTLQDLITMEASSLSVGWTDKISRLIVAGAALKECKTSFHKNMKAELLKEYLEPGLYINSILSTEEDIMHRDIIHLFKPAVIHAMLLTLEQNASDFHPFWLNVRDGVRLGYTDPRLRLREFLREAHFNKDKKTSKHEVTSRCITAWNHFRKNKKIKNIYYHADRPIPMAI